MENYEKLLGQANAILSLIEPFLEEYISLHEAYEASDGKLHGESFTLFLDCSNLDISSEKILQYLQKLIMELTFAQTDNEKHFSELSKSAESFDAKFKVYQLIIETLNYVDTAFELRHEMYSKNRLWEEYLEASTSTVLECIEDGYATMNELSQNVTILMQAFRHNNYRLIANKSISAVYQEKQRRENYKRKFQSIIRMLKENTSLFESVIDAYTLI